MNNFKGKALATSLLLGGTQIVTSILGLARNKGAALLIGPAGLGLYGSYTNLLDLIGTATGFGLASSGVRQVAEADAAGDARFNHEVAVSLRRILVILGVLGLLAFICVANLLSWLSFGDRSQAQELFFIAPCLLFSNLVTGYTVILRGRSEVRRLARLTLFSSIAETVAVLLVFWLSSAHTIAIALTASAAVKFALARILGTVATDTGEPVSWTRTWAIGRGMLKLGIGFMLSSMTFTAVMFGIRREITATVGLDQLGCYTAAYSLAYIFINFVVAGVVSGFYPIAVSRINDEKALQMELSEQLVSGLILAGPLVAFAALFRHQIIPIVFSNQFTPAAEPLRWLLAGCLIRVVHAPLCYIIIANNRPLLFAASELVFGIVGLALAMAFIPIWGIQGAAAAFCLNLGLNTVGLGYVVARINNVKMQATELQLLGLSALAVVFSSINYPEVSVGFFVTICLNLVLTSYAFVLISKRLPIDSRLRKKTEAGRGMLTSLRWFSAQRGKEANNRTNK